jgi:hypothetical protein
MYNLLLMLPVWLVLPTLSNAYDKVLFESPWYQSVPVKLDPVSAHDEQNIIEQLINELNGKFHTNLAALCTVDREVDDTEEWAALMMHWPRKGSYSSEPVT